MMRMVNTFIGTGRKRFVEHLYSVNTLFCLSVLSVSIDKADRRNTVFTEYKFSTNLFLPVPMKVFTILIIMFCGTFAHLKNISFQLEDPIQGSRAMHNLLCSNVKLTRKVLTRNLLRSLMQLRVGTNEVERYAMMMNKQSVRGLRNKGFLKLELF